MRLLSIPFLFIVTSCFQGPGLFKQDGSGSALEMIVTETDGVTSAVFDPNSSATQLLESSDTGASISFPPGSLSIPTTITAEEGANIVGAAVAGQLSIGSVSAASRALVVEASDLVDANNPFSLSVPLVALGLTGIDTDKLAVIYNVKKASESGQRYMGVIPRSQITVSNSMVTFSTRFFGVFQVAETDEVVTAEVSVKTNTEIMTQNEHEALPDVVWTLSTVTYNDSKYRFEGTVQVTGFDEIVLCSFFADEDKSTPYVFSATTDETDDMSKWSTGESLDVHFESPKDQSLYTRLECMDQKGRVEASQWSNKVTVKKFSSGGGSGGGGLSLATGLRISSPYTSRLVSDSSPTITLTGTCDTNSTDPIYLVFEYPNTPESSLPCPSHGQFTFSVGPSSSGANYEHLVVGANAISLHQGNKSEYTIIHHVGSKSISEVSYCDSANTNSGNLYGVNPGDTSNYYILTSNITLTSCTADFFHSSFTGNDLATVFTGDGHTISYSTASLSAPIFAGLVNGAQFSNIILDGFALNTSSGGSPMGILSGTTTCPSVDCVIYDVDFLSASLIDSTATGNVGGVIGRVYGTLRMEGVEFNGDVTAINASYVGGIVGTVGQGGGTATGKLLADFVSMQGDVDCNNYCGGFIGWLVPYYSDYSKITRSAVNGTVTIRYVSETSYGGGFISYFGQGASQGVTAEIGDSYFKGTIVGHNASFNEHFGGFAGYAEAFAKMDFVYADVSFDFTSSGSDAGVAYCGGLVGLQKYTHDGSSTIVFGTQDSFSRITSIPACSNAGLVFGSAVNTTSGGFYDSGTSGSGANVGTTANSGACGSSVTNCQTSLDDTNPSGYFSMWESLGSWDVTSQGLKLFGIDNSP